MASFHCTIFGLAFSYGSRAYTVWVKGLAGSGMAVYIVDLERDPKLAAEELASVQAMDMVLTD